MTTMTDRVLTIAEAAAALRRGELSSVELTRTMIERAKTCQPPSDFGRERLHHVRFGFAVAGKPVPPQRLHQLADSSGDHATDPCLADAEDFARAALGQAVPVLGNEGQAFLR